MRDDASDARFAGVRHGTKNATCLAVVADETERVEMEAARHANNVRSERLMKITAALVQAVSPEQVYEAVVDQVASTLGASSAGLYLLRTESQTVHLVHATGYAEQSLQALRCVPLDASPSLPALDAIRSAKPLWFNSQAQLLEAYSHLSGMVTRGRSYQIACLPIVVQDRILGSLGFTFDNIPPLDVEQQDILLLVTRYCGQALERLRLLDDRLSQVFSNLVGNAVQHGSLEQPVRVRVDGRNTGAVRIEVSNAGCIPKNLLPRLFEPMAGGEQRLQKSRGLGLGLFITRQIIKAHGGSIEVRSSEDQGTIFTAHLPRTSSEAQQGMEQ